MIIDWKSNSYIADITKYGYTGFPISPTVIVDGSLSISFSSGVDVLDSHRCHRKIKICCLYFVSIQILIHLESPSIFKWEIF